MLLCQKSHFLFDGAIYDQVDRVAMGSPLGPVLANIFMCKLEEQAITNFLGNRPIVYKRYVDDTFLVFENQGQQMDPCALLFTGNPLFQDFTFVGTALFLKPLRKD